MYNNHDMPVVAVGVCRADGGVCQSLLRDRQCTWLYDMEHETDTRRVFNPSTFSTFYKILFVFSLHLSIPKVFLAPLQRYHTLV